VVEELPEKVLEVEQESLADVASHPNNQEMCEELMSDDDALSHSKDSGRQPIPVESPVDPALGAASDDGYAEDHVVEATDATDVGVDPEADTENEALEHLDMPGIQEHPVQSFPQPKVPPKPDPYEPDPKFPKIYSCQLCPQTVSFDSNCVPWYFLSNAARGRLYSPASFSFLLSTPCS
jgi:hypothetical protein